MNTSRPTDGSCSSTGQRVQAIASVSPLANRLTRCLGLRCAQGAWYAEFVFLYKTGMTSLSVLIGSAYHVAMSCVVAHVPPNGKNHDCQFSR